MRTNGVSNSHERWVPGGTAKDNEALNTPVPASSIVVRRRTCVEGLRCPPRTTWGKR